MDWLVVKTRDSKEIGSVLLPAGVVYVALCLVCTRPQGTLIGLAKQRAFISRTASCQLVYLLRFSADWCGFFEQLKERWKT